MTESKVILLLQTFTKANLSAFHKYLQSPFFNENVDMLKLFKILLPTIKDTQSKAKRLGKTEVWVKLFSKQTPYNDLKMRRLNSELNRLAQLFLAYQAYQNDPLVEQSYMVKSLNNPKLQKHFDGAIRQARAMEAKLGLKNDNYHFIEFQIQYSRLLFQEKTRKLVDGFEHLEKADYHLDCYYYSKKLKHYCDAIGYKSFLSQQPNINIDFKLVDFLNNSTYKEEPIIKAFLITFKMLTDEHAEPYFAELKEFVINAKSYFSKKDLTTLFVHLQHYCIYEQINKGNTQYFHELFDIQKFLLLEELIIDDGVLDPQYYKNITTVGVYVKEFEWVEQFIQRYTEMLPAQNQENALNYNLAKLYLHQHKYDAVIDQLREVEFKNYVYALGGKMMLVKTYLELDEDLALDNLIDSFRIYIRRNKLISNTLKTQYLNDLRFIKKLSTLAPYDKDGLVKLEAQIQKCKAMVDKKWILEKIAARK